MKTTIVTFCAVLVLSALSIAQSNTLNPLPNTVFVGADGKFETAPDTALIQFNISAQADTAKDAYEQAAKQAEATRQVLRANGIDPKSAEVGFFSVNPQYDWKNPKRKVIGYQVTTSVSLKLKDFSKIGPVTPASSPTPASVKANRSATRWTRPTRPRAKPSPTPTGAPALPRSPSPMPADARSANSPMLPSIPSRTFTWSHP